MKQNQQKNTLPPLSLGFKPEVHFKCGLCLASSLFILSVLQSVVNCCFQSRDPKHSCARNIPWGLRSKYHSVTLQYLFELNFYWYLYHCKIHKQTFT